MRFAYAGTAPFAGLVLQGLADAGRTPVVLVTNPDRPRGRHGTPQAPPIKVLAESIGVPVLQPERLGAPEALDALLIETVEDYDPGQILELDTTSRDAGYCADRIERFFKGDIPADFGHIDWSGTQHS